MSMQRKKISPVIVSEPKPTPLLVDIRTAASLLGISVFAVRNLCWHRETKLFLKPIRHGLKFLFSPVALTEFAGKLVNGEIQFPATPSRPRQKRARQQKYGSAKILQDTETR